MKLAVLSDIHDNIWNLEKALTAVQKTTAVELAFLGDFCAPFTLAQLAEGFPGPIHVIFGNNDGDPYLLTKTSGNYKNVSIYGQFGTFVIGGKKIAINHYPAIAEPIAMSGHYDAVFSGHDHKKYIHRFGKALWANPGEIMGRFGEPSFGVYDSVDNSFAHIHIG